MKRAFFPITFVKNKKFVCEFRQLKYRFEIYEFFRYTKGFRG